MATYTVGQQAQGGIIAYVDATGEHGLVAAPSDQAGSVDLNKATELCNQLSVNGYSDWTLPSLDQLNQLYQNLKLKGLGSFDNILYWSSTVNKENGIFNWFQNFSNGSQYYDGYYDNLSVRAVRTF